jgi:polysaccharide biosynthesis transport protein
MGPMRKPRFLQYLRIFGWIPALAAGLALVLTGFLVLREEPAYVSRASLVAGGKLRLPEGGGYSEELQFFYGTQTELLRSERLRVAALERAQAAYPDYRPLPVDLRIRQAPRTAIFELEATGGEARYTQAFLEALVEEYFVYRREMRASSSDDTLASLTSQLEAEEKRLGGAQDDLHAAQRNTSLAMLREQNSSAGSYLARLNVQRAELRMELQMLDTFTADPTALPEATETTSTDASIPMSTRTPEYLNARQRVEMLKLERAELGRYLRPQHPKIQEFDEDIRRAEELVAVFRRQNRDQLVANRESTLLRLQAVEDSIREWESKVLETSQRVADIDQLRRNAERIQALYERLLGLLQSLDLNKNLDQETMSVMQEPTIAEAVPRGLGRRLAQAGMFGLFLGLGVVYLLERTDDRLRALKDLNERFKDEVLGIIPRVQTDRRTGQIQPVTPHDDRHAFAESWRTIRSSLLFMGPAETRPRLILVTSAVPSEGKSTVALNLARTIALGGARVLLIDADLRRGALHEAFNLSSTPGLAETLRPLAPDDLEYPSAPRAGRSDPEAGTTDGVDGATVAEATAGEGDPGLVDAWLVERLEQAVQPTDVASLEFLARGHHDDDVGELFLSPDAVGLLRLVRKRYDYVVLDSAPILAADDTSNLASRVDGVLFVVRSGYTRGKMAGKALEFLRQRQGRIVGLVFNRASSGSSDGYYYDRYKDYYGGKRKSRGQSKTPSAPGGNGSGSSTAAAARRRRPHGSRVRSEPCDVPLVFRLPKPLPPAE